MYQTARMRAAMRATRMKYLRSLGYKSDVFNAKYRGGKCGLSGLSIPQGEPVAFFEDKGLCLAPAITNEILKRQYDAAPKCCCGQGRKIEYDDCCCVCAALCELYLGERPRDVTRETPLVRDEVAS